jgi:hypothetical protein
MMTDSVTVPLSYKDIQFIYTFKETDNVGITLSCERTNPGTPPWRGPEIRLSTDRLPNKMIAVMILCKFVHDGGTLGEPLQRILKRLLAEYSTDEKFELCVWRYLHWHSQLKTDALEHLDTLTCAQVMEFVLPYRPWGVTVPLKSII